MHAITMWSQKKVKSVKVRRRGGNIGDNIKPAWRWRGERPVLNYPSHSSKSENTLTIVPWYVTPCSQLYFSSKQIRKYINDCSLICDALFSIIFLIQASQKIHLQLFLDMYITTCSHFLRVVKLTRRKNTPWKCEISKQDANRFKNKLFPDDRHHHILGSKQVHRTHGNN